MASSALPNWLPVNNMEGVNFCLSPSLFTTDICQVNPNLSWAQPYLSLQGYLSMGISALPPSIIFFHVSLVSLIVSHVTKIEMAGVNLNIGPPFKPIIFFPFNSNITTIGVSVVILEFLKTEQLNSAA